MAWGLWRVPESRVRLLGPLRGRRILELGCGAARWSVALRARGARPVGFDLSGAQLRKARRIVDASRRPFPLVGGSAESLPFRDRSFDTVFCDWGALTFADPLRAVPEAARVLRSGGVLAFAAASPLRHITYDRRTDRQTPRLRRPYHDLHRVEYRRTDPVEYSLPYGGWFDLFHRSGLRVERLLETVPGPRDRSRYLSRSDDRFARQWPIEALWRLRRDAA
jgi:ubiquinone/menaquinone biosynthesis C-methylase UbiE